MIAARQKTGESLMKRHILVNMLFLIVLLWSAASYALPDRYPGDTSIYGGTATATSPNVLIIVDTSGSMDWTVPGTQLPYNSATVYPLQDGCKVVTSYIWKGKIRYTTTNTKCATNAVYNASNDTKLLDSVESVTTSCNTLDPKTLLKTTGTYAGKALTTAGSCNTSDDGSYFLGNYMNWLNGPVVDVKKIAIARDVVKNIIQTTSGVNFGLMRYDSVNSEGGRFIKVNVLSKDYVTTVKNMDGDFLTTTTPSTKNRTALLAAVDTLTASGATPLAETLFEALRYFSGNASAFGNTIGLTDGLYTTPIGSECQKNYVIFITDGASTADNNVILDTIGTNGDTDGDTAEPKNINHPYWCSYHLCDNYWWDYYHSLDDVAKVLYDTKEIVTYTVGFDLSSDLIAVDLLKRTADSDHGHGAAYLAGNQAELTKSLTQIVSNIMVQDTSFVAPVVPVSPENRTASASRVYIGLFKPLNGIPWQGNLKKYGLDSSNYLTDRDGLFASSVDLVNNTTLKSGADGLDDRTGLSGVVNGAFISTSSSFWGTTQDGGKVSSGGVGERLLTRTTARKIYTNKDAAQPDLTQTTNAFSVANITKEDVSLLSDTERDKLVNFIYGIDVYDDNANSNTTEKREWLLGDVLHSKPMVVNYRKYDFNTANEIDSNENKTMIFVGSNDGMLHAFNDYDGSEAWAFIPKDVLRYLQNIHSDRHPYMVDSSVYSYIYDENKNGTIETGDKVILLVGLRRGGGTESTPTSGFYYALDVTAPQTPKILWSINNSQASYAELAEAWSEPKIVKVKVGANSYKIAAVFGGGYDNPNEDGRYGATLTFPNMDSTTLTVPVAAATGAGVNTSAGTSTQTSPKGRDIFIVDMETGTRLWSYVSTKLSTDPAVSFSVASEVAALDTYGRGYTDKLYVVDTGGNLWRFNIGTGNTATWKGKKVFSPNVTGATDIGRKAFYKPAVVVESGYDMVFYGTGDREHPLNSAVVDRIYAIKVRDDDTTVKTEADLVDVTTNQLQATYVTQALATAAITTTLNDLNTKSGWFIKLNESVNSGEKVLSSPMVFNRVLYVTTFSPISSTDVVDPCQQSANLGSSSLYALNYLTGEAVLNYSYGSAGNDALVTNNSRTVSGTNVLQRADRRQTVSPGIASSPIVVISNTGQASLMVGGSGNAVMGEVTKGGVVRTLFWRQK